MVFKNLTGQNNNNFLLKEHDKKLLVEKKRKLAAEHRKERNTDLSGDDEKMAPLPSVGKLMDESAITEQATVSTTSSSKPPPQPGNQASICDQKLKASNIYNY